MTIVSRHWLTVSVLIALLLGLSSAAAQQRSRIPRIGYLTPSTSSTSNFEAFREGLRDVGYIEGKNLVIERRANEGKLDRNPALAAELVRLTVDMIVAAGSGEIRAAKEATSRFLSSWCAVVILLEADSSRVSPARAEISPDWPPSVRS
jgi:putative ABC transport system substrate-binding protein